MDSIAVHSRKAWKPSFTVDGLNADVETRNEWQRSENGESAGKSIFTPDLWKLGEKLRRKRGNTPDIFWYVQQRAETFLDGSLNPLRVSRVAMMTKTSRNHPRHMMIT